MVAVDASDATHIQVGSSLANPLDVRLLKTSCLPWELSLSEFKTQFRAAARKGVGALESMAVQAGVAVVQG